MSMENAILEHAAALREVAAAIKSMGNFVPAEIAAIEQKAEAYEAKVADKKPEVKDAEIEKAVQKVEEAAKDEQKTESADDGALVELDYTKDVRPVLLAVNKKAGQPALKALLNDFGAATGDKLKPEQYTDVLAAANKILAG